MRLASDGIGHRDPMPGLHSPSTRGPGNAAYFDDSFFDGAADVALAEEFGHSSEDEDGEEMPVAPAELAT